MEESTKPVHTLILDAGPLLTNIPSLSTLRAQSSELLTTPSVLSEVRDPNARSRVESLYLSFLTPRAPKPDSVKVVTEFARKTGDKAVLSAVDLEVLALAYEIECERNGGDWRLRRVPGQKGLNGRPPVKAGVEAGKEGDVQAEGEPADGELAADGTDKEAAEYTTEASNPSDPLREVTNALEATKLDRRKAADSPSQTSEPGEPSEPSPNLAATQTGDNTPEDGELTVASDSDSEGWITPSNIKKHQAGDQASISSSIQEPKIMQVATITSDFAVQNVLLQLNLNLLSTTTLQRIRHLRTTILRCHACFFTTKEMTKQFCPRCGKPTLTRVSCSTNANGEFKLYLKKNMQWNSRGDRYSIPKPVSGSSSGKWQGGGGKGGWGSDLILAEDQKEYVKAMTDGERRAGKEKNLMDEEYLPGILTGERNRGGGRVKVGAGRNINSRKR